MKVAAVSAVMVFALALAACTSSGGSARSSASVATAVNPSATPTMTASPTSTPWSREVAQQQYLAMVAPSNAAIAAVNNFDTDSGDLTEANRLATGVADSLDTFARDVAAGQWPADAQAEAAALVKSTSTETVQWRLAGSASTVEAFNAALHAIPPSGDAQAFRIALGLPGVTIPT